MSENPNIEYEILTQEIYQTINKNELYKNINVQHNVKIKGKSGCEHQIDVYWEFINMGETHRVAIECKYYNKKVSIGKIRDFYGVLEDIGDIKGIFVTKVGYQRGAKEFAEFHGISLKELRFPVDLDWEDRIKDISIKGIINSIHVTNIEFHYNKEWCKNNLKENITIKNLRTDEVIIKDINNEYSLYELENKLSVDINTGGQTNVIKKYEFEDAYLVIPQYPKIKIDGITFTYDINVTNNDILIKGDEIAKAILKDVKEENIDFFWKNR